MYDVPLVLEVILCNILSQICVVRVIFHWDPIIFPWNLLNP